METDQIKLDIEERISKIDQSFPNYWPRSFYEGLLEDNIVPLEKALKKIKVSFKIGSIFLITIIVLLVIKIISKNMEGVESFRVNSIALFILCFLVSLVGVFNQYKIKVNLEYKIFLLRLLGKINQDKSACKDVEVM